MISLTVVFLTWHFFFREESLRQQLPWIALSMTIGINLFLFLGYITGNIQINIIGLSFQFFMIFMLFWGSRYLLNWYKMEDIHNRKKIYSMTAIIGAIAQTVWVMLISVLTHPYFMD